MDSVRLSLSTARDVRAPGPPRVTCELAAGIMVLLTVYNPLSLVGWDRLLEVSEGLRHFDVVVCPGTQVRQWRGDPAHTYQQTHHHHVLMWGAGLETYTSAGLAVLIHRRFRYNQIVEITTLPASQQGRSGGVRIRTPSLDFKVIGFYWPPFSSTPGTRGRWQSCVQASAGWLQAELSCTLVRCTPFLLGNLNDNFGGMQSLGSTCELGGRIKKVLEAIQKAPLQMAEPAAEDKS